MRFILPTAVTVRRKQVALIGPFNPYETAAVHTRAGGIQLLGIVGPVAIRLLARGVLELDAGSWRTGLSNPAAARVIGEFLTLRLRKPRTRP